MKNKKLSLGSQEFSEIIGNNCIYVDKTELVHRLINDGKYYFLSRPRRFGKSLLANTIKEIFKGSKKLFDGLWIYDKWDWETTHPVIKISFSNISHNVAGLENAIHIMLDDIAKEYNIKYSQSYYPYKFKELITELSQTEKVVIVIDEYDKPIIDHLTELDKAEENRHILKNFYSVLKDADAHLRFVFITGVSKFSKVSIFSDLNNLEDITLDEKYGAITGFTKEEVESYFPEHLKDVADRFKDIFPDIMTEIKRKYNGYSWDGKTRVYNPVSLMNFFSKRMFGSYWFTTGTPTFLMDIIRERRMTAFGIENSMFSSTEILDKYDFRNINFSSLLFQTGYLTIETLNPANGRIKLAYPNAEVEESFSKHIVAELTSGYLDQTQSLLYHIEDSFTDNRIPDFIKHLNQLLKTIPYQIVEDSESYFHSLFYLVMKLIGFDIECEILTIDGRVDAVVKTDDNIYVIEFKINQSAQKAIEQIKEKGYAEKYAADNRPITMIGINFDTEKKRADDYLVEDYPSRIVLN